MGNAPTLVRLGKTYGDDIAKSWLMIQIMDLAEFSGIKEKPDVNSILNLAGIITSNYGYLKVTELMVFFQKFKSGEYGKFYGVIDNMVITTALNSFMDYRKQIIDIEQKKIDAERREKTMEEAIKNGISYDEYIKRKSANKDSL